MISHKSGEEIKSTKRFIIMKYGPTEHLNDSYHGFGMFIVMAYQNIYIPLFYTLTIYK